MKVYFIECLSSFLFEPSELKKCHLFSHREVISHRNTCKYTSKAAVQQGEEGGSETTVIECIEYSQQILKFQDEAGFIALKFTMESEPGLQPRLMGHILLLLWPLPLISVLLGEGLISQFSPNHSFLSAWVHTQQRFRDIGQLRFKC